MATGINNFNSVIVNQTVGNVYGGDSRQAALETIQKKLQELEAHINKDVTLNQTNAGDTALMAVQAIQMELTKDKPRKVQIERWLSNVGNIASLASVVDQMHPFLKTLLG